MLRHIHVLLHEPLHLPMHLLLQTGFRLGASSGQKCPVRGRRSRALSRECRVRCQACQLRARGRSLRTYRPSQCAPGGSHVRSQRVPRAQPAGAAYAASGRHMRAP
jgi:hypothetical protein